MSVMESNVFECFICKKQLDLPRDFPCQHTFCALCIRNLIEKTDHTEFLKLECPVCFDGFSLSSANLSLQELVELFPINQQIEELNCTANSNEARKSCGPCRSVNEEKIAQYHCRDCRESLCEMCYTYMHRRIPGQESHRITSINIYFESGPVDVKEFCHAHPQKWVEIYCHDHELPCCTSCIDSDHKYCLHVETLDQAFKAKENGIKPSVLKKLIGNMREKANEALQTLEKQENSNVYTNINDEVSSFVTTFMDKLATIRKHFDLLLKRAYEGDEGEINLCKIQNMQIKGFLQLLHEAQQIIQGLERVGSKRQGILTKLKLKQLLRLCFQKMQKCSEKKTDRDLTINPTISEFDQIESIAEIQENVLDSLLTARVKEQLHLLKMYLNFDLEGVTARYSNLVPKKLAEFTYNQNKDKSDDSSDDNFKEAYFNDGVIMSSGKILLIDSYQEALFAVDQDGKFTILHDFSSRAYRSSPWAICMDDSEQMIAVTVSYRNMVYLFQLSPLFELIKTIEGHYEWLQFFGENLIGVAQNEIVMFNKDGDRLRTFYRLKQNPVCVAVSSDCQRLYIPIHDYDTCKIMCLGLDGQVIYRRQIPLEFKDRSVRLHGMDLDCYGNLYVCEAGGEVLQLSNDGSQVRPWLRAEGLKKAKETANSKDSDSESEEDEESHQKSISFDKSGKKFLLCTQTNTVELYELN